jgi:uncharacterized protein
MALLFAQSPSNEIVLVGKADDKGTDTMLQVISEAFRPFTLSILYSDEHRDLIDAVPFVEDYKTIGCKTTAYICRNFACQSPITDLERFKEALS